MNHKGTILIETDRLMLRKFKKSDANDMFKNWGSDAKVTEFLSWLTHKNIKDSEDIINLWISEYEDNSVYNWVIELKDNNEAIGNISIVKLENINDSCEIGYCISSKYWNKSITTEAFKAIIKYLFVEVRVNRICAKHDINNAASGKVMQKCGMVYEGTGLTIREPKLCGVKQFQTDQDERYIVLLFKTDKFEGTLISSAEGEMIWIDRNSLNDYTLVNDFMELLKVFDSDYYSEFMYERNKSGDEDWLIRLY